MRWLAKETECVKEALYVFQKCTGVCEQDKIEICIFSRERSNLSSHSFGSRDGPHSVLNERLGLLVCARGSRDGSHSVLDEMLVLLVCTQSFGSRDGSHSVLDEMLVSCLVGQNCASNFASLG